MFREIRGVQGGRRWFQCAFFDLFVTQDRAGEVQWFQLCYARDTWRERVLEWRRGRGFQHMKLLLPADISRLVEGKVREFARPARRYRRPGATTPRWLERMRSRIKTEARLAFLDSAQERR